MPVPFLTDPGLVDRLHKGDERAFRLVFDRLHRKIYRFAFHFLKEKEICEEVVQDTFLSFWLNRDTLDNSKPVEPYLFTVARRTVIDHWRKAATSRKFRDELFQRMETSGNDTEEKVFLKELEEITESGIRQLTDQQQQIFRLSRYEGLTYEEIAVKMRISKNTVKYHLVNALKTLREHFSKYDIIYSAWLLFIFF